MSSESTISVPRPSPLNGGISGGLDANEVELNPNQTLRCLLSGFRFDLYRGIVRIEVRGTVKSYAAAKKKDAFAGQVWNGSSGLESQLEDYLSRNNYANLRLAAVMPGGPCLVGIDGDHEPAIRQRSRVIVNVIVTGQGNRILLPHAEAVEYLRNNLDAQCANEAGIVQGVKEAGFRVPALPMNHEKEGLVAASEEVMGLYLEIPPWQTRAQGISHQAMLDCSDKTPSSRVLSVGYDPLNNWTYIASCSGACWQAERGAILWL